MDDASYARLTAIFVREDMDDDHWWLMNRYIAAVQALVAIEALTRKR